MSGGKRGFPRGASGLVRIIGPVSAVLISVAFTVGGAWQVQIFVFPGLSPLPENLWLAGIPPILMSFIVVGIAFVIIMAGYSILMSAMPRSGGGYVAISRVVSPFAAFVAAFFEFVSIASSFGVIGVFSIQAWPLLFTTHVPVGPVMSISDIGFTAAGLLMLVVMTVICALGARSITSLMQALLLVVAVLGLYFFYLLGVAIVNPSTLQAGIATWAKAQGFAGVTVDTYVRAALAQGLDATSVGSYWTAVSASALGAYFCYVGFAALTFVSGEIRHAERDIPRIGLATPLLILGSYIVMVAFGTYAAAAVGHITLANGDRWSFYEAYSFLSYGGGNLQQAGVPNVGAWAGTIAAMTGAGLGWSSLNVLLLLFVVLMYAKDLPPAILTGSRLIFAMSFDGVLPEPLSRVNGRLHSPVLAVICVGLFGVLGATAESCVFCNGGSLGPGGAVGNALTSFFTNSPIYNIDLLDAVFFSLFSLAVVLLPFRRSDLFLSAPFKPGGKLGTAAIGIAGLIANLDIAWLILTSPQDAYSVLAPTPANWYALGSTVVLGAVAALIYAYYRHGPPSKRTDYSAIFSEIPPE